jgi:hypothetical protein
MYHLGRIVALCVLVFVWPAAPAKAQNSAGAPTEAPAIRRWVDVQSVHATSRFRWNTNSAGRETASDVQWQSQLRGRFLFDRAGRYHVGTFASTGASFAGSFNNTGIGIGRSARPFALRHLYLSAEPVKGVELQAGGIAMNRGVMGEQVAYDNDGFMIGERLTLRPTTGPVTQIAVTAGHLGDLRDPSVFNRFDSLNDASYRQALVGLRLGSRATASVDYTHDAGRSIVREGVNVRLPARLKVTAVRVEAYHRVDPDARTGFHVGADAAIGKLAVTAGVMSVDAAYGALNGDRYETGTRYYSIYTWPLTSQLSVQIYHSRAFDIEFPIPLAHRFDFVATFNPTAALKRAGVF